jgi:succinate dehydrogenase/fumarate reductase flavoprotein subunit
MAASLGRPPTRRLEAELVVVGFGGAGATAAIEARRLGADVLVVERAPLGLEGGSTRIAAQGYLCMTSKGAAKNYLEALAHGTSANPDRLATWVQGASQNNAWLKSIGAKPEFMLTTHNHAEYPELPGADSINKFRVRDSEGRSGLWHTLNAHVQHLGIRIEYGYRATGLLSDRKGRISGVACLDATDSRLEVTASRGVVLASGGFAASPRHLGRYIPPLANAGTAGSPYSTGDGIDMAVAVGARLIGMTSVSGPYLAFLPPGYSATVPLEPLLPRSQICAGAFIVVDPVGSRFMDERLQTRHGRLSSHEGWPYLELPSRASMIFDQALLRDGPIVSNDPPYGWAKGVAGLRWSDDNLRELSAEWILAAESIGQLAARLACDKEVLEETIREWNSDCAEGVDGRFGRRSDLRPLMGPPYFGVPLVPSILNTQGGPERDGRSRVIGQDGQPIGGLFSAGEMGSVFTGLYQGAGNLADCLVSGRAAAVTALRSDPRRTHEQPSALAARWQSPAAREETE